MRLPAIFFICFCCLLFCAACDAPSHNELEEELHQKNPEWKGECSSGSYSLEIPVFDFSGQEKINAVALSGKGLRDLSPLKDITLRILSLRDYEKSTTDDLRKLNWEPDSILEFRQCPELSDFRSVSSLPVTVLSLTDLPKFTDTSILRCKLKSINLTNTGVRKLEFPYPEYMEDFRFDSTLPADLSQIGAMTKLCQLELKGVHNFSNIDFSALARLENLNIEKSNAADFPVLKPDILRSVWIEDSPNFKSLESLSGKIMDRLCLIRSGDPGKLLAKLYNAKISLLVINGAEISDISFLKQIKDLNCVRFQNCKGLPEKIDLPSVEIIIEEL